jgi:hypothetical protein
MPSLPRIPLAVAALAAAAACHVPAAGAAPRETLYDVTFEAELVERWRFDERVSTACAAGDAGGRCERDAVGRGSARIFLRTRSPQRVSVMTGAGGLQPMIVASIDAGIPLRGAHRRAGSYTDTYSGAWDAANPDQVAPAQGCGVHTLRTDVSLAWSGRGELRPVVTIDDLPACPTGPPIGFSYDGGGVPALSAVPARVSERKFGRTKQFRISGTRTWRGTIRAVNRTDPGDTYVRSGASEIRWSWSATFRKVAPRRRSGRR